MLDWITQNWIEIIGATTGIMYIFLSIRQKISLWSLGILTSAFYIVVFFQSKFYADMALQIYYLFISIYGWYYWWKNKAVKGEELHVSSISKKNIIILTLITITLTILIAYVLKFFTDSPLPWWDAFTTAAGITATWMLVRKYIEHWLVWVVVDSVCVGLYFYKALYPTVVLYIIYTIMAYIGYVNWKKSNK